MANNEEKDFASVNIKCDTETLEKKAQTIENTEKMTLRFLHV